MEPLKRAAPVFRRVNDQRTWQAHRACRRNGANLNLRLQGIDSLKRVQWNGRYLFCLHRFRRHNLGSDRFLAFLAAVFLVSIFVLILHSVRYAPSGIKMNMEQEQKKALTENTLQLRKTYTPPACIVVCYW